jgi:hypothetical protein
MRFEYHFMMFLSAWSWAIKAMLHRFVNSKFWEYLIAHFHFIVILISETANMKLQYVWVVKSIQHYNLWGLNVGITDGNEVRHWEGHRWLGMHTMVHEDWYGHSDNIICYKPEVHEFETRWSGWFFSIYLIIPAALGPGIYSDSNRNEYQKQKSNVSWE